MVQPKNNFGLWQPIDSAPKDGTRILAYDVIGLEQKPGIATVKWDWPGEWHADPTEASEYSPERCVLTHWMPLPEPPVQQPPIDGWPLIQEC